MKKKQKEIGKEADLAMELTPVYLFFHTNSIEPSSLNSPK